MKRVLDVVGALTLLAVFCLPMLLIALAIWVSAGTPILFVQMRKGYQGMPFRVWKFRTMTVADQDCRSQDLVRDMQDNRVTPIGRVLRRTHLDELPQLWNVLRGDMSLVGPRPISFSIAREQEEQFPDAVKRYQVKPGLTGPVQVFDRPTPEVNLEQCHRLDMEYVAISSSWRRLWRDMGILWQTVFVVIFAQSV